MSSVFLGEVRAMPFGSVPKGWAPCDGRLLPVAQNTGLFSLLNFTYGGDNETNFALPTLPPLAAESGSLQYCICLQGIYPPHPAEQLEDERPGEERKG